MKRNLTWCGIRLLQVAAVVGAVHVAAGCSHISEMPGPNGERLVATKCNGMALDYSDCLRRIAETCSNGYNLLGTTGNTTYASLGTASLNQYGGIASASASPLIQRQIFAVCK